MVDKYIYPCASSSSRDRVAACPASRTIVSISGFVKIKTHAYPSGTAFAKNVGSGRPACRASARMTGASIGLRFS